MDEDNSLNGEKSVASSEDGSCSPSPSLQTDDVSQESQLKKELDIDDRIDVDDCPTRQGSHSLKRKMDDKIRPDSSSTDNTECENTSGLTSSHPTLLNADILHSLQYFALLRQTFPNGSLINLPVIPHTSGSQVSPPLVGPTKMTTGLNHTCPSCGICFSSVSTLSAHVTYYCSQRLKSKTDSSNGEAAEAFNGRSDTPDHPSDPASDDQQCGRPPAPKIRKSGRYYACPYCSFSADKRVSLNRHMRVHVGLPLLATHPVSPPPEISVEDNHGSSSHPASVELSPERITPKNTEGKQRSSGAAETASNATHNLDKYCHECKIQFSSLKTYQVHKQHYCQYRKTGGGNHSHGLPSPQERIDPSQESSSRTGPMTILVLPTHPPIVIPLCILQSARLLTAEHPMPPQCVIVSIDGEIQFRTDKPEEKSPREVPSERTVSSRPAQTASTPDDEEALDLSSKTSDTVTDDPQNLESRKEDQPYSGSLRIREELAHIHPSPASTLPFLPPKVFAELEALGMCLGVPSGHEMASNPAQWLAMLENAVLQASSSSALANIPSGILPRNLAQHRKTQNLIPCEECNITFRRMESYLVHKQYYCAARHQMKEPSTTPPNTSDMANGNVEEKDKQNRVKIACNQCGVEFESAHTLQAHRSFYCPKRESANTALPHDPSPKPKETSPIPEMNGKKGTEIITKTPSVTPASNPRPLSVESPTASGSGSNQGWKCPCCDVVSPTAAAAQKHVETHSNVRAFRCSVCGYRGNTLRGMRTHVRIHFDRRNADLCEDNYITCIMGNEFSSSNNRASSSSPADVDHIFKSLGLPADVCAKVLSNPPEGSGSLLTLKNRDLTGSSLAGLQFFQLAQRIANNSPGPTTGAGCRSDKLFLCDLCCYSSSYRGNVIRHSKLVHGREINDVVVVSSSFLQSPKSNFSDSGRTKVPSPRIAVPSVEKLVQLEQISPPVEPIQVKIDPDDVATSPKTSPSIQSPNNHGDDLANNMQKHCKSCNITFTYMSTFLAHKKYYCSSHTPDASPSEATHA